MKFNIDLIKLRYILKCLRNSVKINTTDPTGCINIRIKEDGSILFSSSNDTIGVMVAVTESVTIFTPGAVAISFNDLHLFVNSLPSWSEDTGGVKQVQFKLNDKSVSVYVENFYKENKSSKSTIKLKIFDYIENKNNSFNDTSFVLSASMLKAAIDKVSPALDQLHSIPYLRGMNIKFEGPFIYFAGTNGVLLSEYVVKNTSNLTANSFLLSYDLIKCIRNMIITVPKEEAQVYFSISDRVVKVKIYDVIFWGQTLIGHTYPDYRSELLREYKHKIVIEKETLINAITPLIGALVEDDNYRMTISLKDNNARLYNDYSESEFEISEFVGDFCVDLNGKLCKEVVNMVKDEKILIKFSDEKNNVLFDSELFEDQKTLITYIRRRG